MLAQLRSRAYLTYAAFFSALFVFYVSFLACAAARLAALGDDDGALMSILGLTLPLGCVFQAVAGPTIDRAGLRVALSATWLLAVAAAGLAAVPSLPVQVGAFVAFAAMRAFLFSTMTAHLSATFGFATLGVTIGALILIGGVAGLSQQGFLAWGLASGSFFAPDFALLALVIAAGAFPVSLWCAAADSRVAPAPHAAAPQGALAAAALAREK